MSIVSGTGKMNIQPSTHHTVFFFPAGCGAAAGEGVGAGAAADAPSTMKDEPQYSQLTCDAPFSIFSAAPHLGQVKSIRVIKNLSAYSLYK